MNLILAQITSNDNLFLGVITTAGGAMAAAIAHVYFASNNKDKALVDMVVAKNKEVVEVVSKEFEECKKDAEASEAADKAAFEKRYEPSAN